MGRQVGGKNLGSSPGERMNLKNKSVPFFLVYIFLLAGMYYSSFGYLTRMWQRDDYNYCYLVPLVVLYLIWEQRLRLAAVRTSSSWSGLVFISFGIVFFWLGELGGEYTALFISLWLMIVGLCWLHLGGRKIKVIAFPLLLLLAMFPPPNFLTSRLSLKLKLISSQIGVILMRFYGMTAHRQGNVIDLGFTRLQVVDACSGIRYLFPIIILGLLLAWFFRAHWWKRLVLVLSTIPLIVFANGVRIALTGILYEPFGPKIAEGFLHDFAGWFTFMVALAVLLPEMWLLNKIPFGRPPAKQVPVKVKTSGSSLPVWPKLAVAVLLLGLTLAVSQGVDFREKVPAKQSFSHFPLELGEWRGQRQTMETRFIDTLDLSDYAIVDYRDQRGRAINLYVAYYESQRKGESIHSPATCLPGSGWDFRKAGTARVAVPGYDGGFTQVNRALMQKTGFKQLTYYWFPQRGRILTNAYQLKIFAFWDALTKQRTDGALVRLISPIAAGETVTDADARLQKFMGLLLPALDEYIPGSQAVALGEHRK
ncbi:MAG: VPLPA-CTERM-specific exosortase XrtD [Pseudomonadota bacterium]|nr:VPLPA-CTERM-specific exosortase XrtD [Pseudomonadota bacterium]